eukprot:3607760-Prymnesium_polylepis.1
MAALRRPLLTGFGTAVDGQISTLGDAAAAFEAAWVAECALWRDRIQPGDMRKIPPALKEPGVLASFTDPIIETLPFPTRCGP